jgi:hypothetical protein
MSKAPPMIRSRNQLATSYAPESFFTFEGATGACISHSMMGESPDLQKLTKQTILERIEQFSSAWFDMAMAARANKEGQADVLALQCVERDMLDDMGRFRSPGADKFVFSRPSLMGYTPAPLTFVCRYCEVFREYAKLSELVADTARLEATKCSKSGGCCSWEQLDVIFVHWSGNWSPISPRRFDFRDRRARQLPANCGSCGSPKHRLNRDSPRIGGWYFYCAQCGKRSQNWGQRDADTLEILQVPVGEGRLRGPAEVNMEATSYRASAAYYVHAEQFIDFEDDAGRLSSLLRRDEEEAFGAWIGRRFGFPVSPLTNADVAAACEKVSGAEQELAEFRDVVIQIQEYTAEFGTDPDGRPGKMLKVLKDHRARIIKGLEDRRIVKAQIELPGDVTQRVSARRLLFASKYDPFQLAVEHEMLRQNRLDVSEEVRGKRGYVSFKNLDTDLQPDKPEEIARLEVSTKRMLTQLGVEDMGLIRDFSLCRFSFGYSRMSPTPVLRDKHNLDMPVRLRLFPMVHDEEGRKHPIYVVQQQNQALYVRLNEAMVREWVRTIGCADAIADGTSVGAHLLTHAPAMDRFLNHRPRSTEPETYHYVYTLLHSYAHLVMHQLSEYSGLDLGSLGEYLFPADLAFVVYRNGTTMDLGNLSAMWRNKGEAMLGSLIEPRSLMCGTGSLCTLRHSACPDCLMVPETSCLTGNHFLSRSVLRSTGGRPVIDMRLGGLEGYLDVVARSVRS